MRPIFIPVVGTTDATGAATLQIPLERTGDWRNVKFVLQTSGSAEWAVLKTGSPINFGRGRRVTLGPELLEPQDTVTVSVSGGPPSAAITGSVSGKGGAASEIIGDFVPAPNTIALDVSSPLELLGTITTVGNGDTVSASFPIRPGTQGIAYIFYSGASGFNAPLQIQAGGDQTHQLNLFAGGAGLPAPNSAGSGRWYPVDKNANCSVTSNTGSVGTTKAQVAFFALTYDPTSIINDTLSSQSIFGDGAGNLQVTQEFATPAPWQAAITSAVVDGSTVANGATLTLVAALVGEFVYVHDVDLKLNAAGNFVIDRSDGSRVAAGQAPSAGLPAIAWDGRGGAGLVAGLSLRINNNSGASITVLGTVGYAQK